MCFGSVIVCSLLYYLPDFIGSLELAFEESRLESLQRAKRFEMLQTMTGIDYLELVTRQELRDEATQVAEENSTSQVMPGKLADDELASAMPFDSQLRIELPEGVNYDSVEIINDYMNRDILFKIPGAGEAYPVEYPMLGDSNHIEDITYDAKRKGLELTLHMDGIYEPQVDYDERFIYLDFSNPKDVYDKIIVIDAGHGGGQPGAVRGDVYEKYMTLPMVLKIKEKFDADTEHNIGVYYTRLTDCDVALADRIGLANDLKANLFISVHINALPNDTTTNGTGVMYNEKNPGGKHGSKVLSEILLKSCLENLGSESKGLFYGSTIHILHHAEVPASLIEVGFISNERERNLMQTDEYQYKLAQGVYEGALQAIADGY